MKLTTSTTCAAAFAMMSLGAQAFVTNSQYRPSMQSTTALQNAKSGSDDVPDRRAFMTTALTGVLGAVVASTAMPNAANAALSVVQYGDESLMAPKDHGTTAQPVQSDLQYGVSQKLADKICSYNRHFAENGGYFVSTNFEDAVLEAKGPLTFYDSVSGKPLFVAPLNRTPDQFLAESESHGWPSFRDDEVVWENVRVIKGSGETVSVDGTHLGHNLPDRKGNRYCINLVCIAGKPV
eukprot:scaffold89075_cov36-Attheya_sp.AAC.3